MSYPDLYRFDGLYSQDSFAHYDYARQIWEQIQRWQMPPTYWWPIGYSSLVALTFILTGLLPLAGQLVSSLAAAATVILTYHVTRRLLLQQGSAGTAAYWTANLAAILVAVSGQTWHWGIMVMTDTTAVI